MEDELITRKEKCLWLNNNICKIPEHTPCPDDCDLKGVDWNKEAIITKIKEEQERVKQLKKEGMFKNRDKIGDIIAGIWVMENALKNNFDYTETHVIDPETEKTASIFARAMGRFRKKR
jgi:hypothetical protein